MSHSVDSSPRIGAKFRRRRNNGRLFKGKLDSKLFLSQSVATLPGSEEDTDSVKITAKSWKAGKTRFSKKGGSAGSGGSNALQKTQAFFTSLKDKWSKGGCSKSGNKHLVRQQEVELPPKESELLVEEAKYHSPLRKVLRSTISYAKSFSMDENKNENVTSVDAAKVDENQEVGCKPNNNNKISDDSKLSPSLVSNLKQYSFYQLRVHLISGRDLVARDTNGMSDPYVKFKINGKLLYKSKIVYRDLNPTWDEVFTLPVEDPFTPINIKVFDYDWGLQDDFMGSAFLEMIYLDFGKPCNLVLPLQDPRCSENLGEIVLTATLIPKTQQDKEQYFQRNGKFSESNRRLKSQIWNSVVTIVLIKAKNLLSKNEDGLCSPYIKFRLGNEKYKSKVAAKTSNPKWLEQFDLHLYDDQTQELEITAWDKDRAKDDLIGKCSVSLVGLEKETTHKITKELEERSGRISLLLTISGTTALEGISDLDAAAGDEQNCSAFLKDRYVIWKTFKNLRDIGHLTVKVYKAQGLAAKDFGGTSDPFCVLELVNARLQTQTEYKTLNPNWHKMFTFNVKDINSVMEITVYDEDKDHKVEFLGKVAIPLLRIRNGEKRWYPLKDKKLRTRAEGYSPQILLEMSVAWNPIRACIRTLNPKEIKYMQGDAKFKRQVLVGNVMRIKNVLVYVMEIEKYIQSLFEWESKFKSLAAFVAFILLCHYMEPYMIPVALLLVFLRCYIVKTITGSSVGWNNANEDEEDMDEDDKFEEEEDKQEEKKSLKERYQAIQEVIQTVQNSTGFIASLAESVKNVFNFTVPFLSYLSIALLIAATLILYWIPVRYLIMLWGINKFTRKILRPNSVPNNELLDLLSRVPDDEDLMSYTELKLRVTGEGNASATDAAKKGKQKKQKST